jgi:tetratricopeptide (TPR) repeat protein
MKSEERHELQQNDLVGSLARLYLFLRNYGAYLLLVVALVILGLEYLHIQKINQERKVQQAWDVLDQAQTPQQIQDTVISVYSFPAVQAQAYNQIGYFYLQTINLGNPPEGIGGVKVDRAQAIAAAEQTFNTVLQNYADQSLAVARAKLGLALTYEDAGEWDQAAGIYKEMLSAQASATEKAFTPMAQYRLAHLDEWSSLPLVGPAIVAPPTTSSSINSSDIPTLDQP